MFNLALLVHGEEALLAVGFIFTIHFFNGHFRPDKFPIDTVIFTGAVPEHELRGRARRGSTSGCDASIGSTGSSCRNRPPR